MKNLFFKVALTQAMRLAGKPGRLLQLVARLAHQLVRMDRKNIFAIELKERLRILGRLIVAYDQGRYPIITLKALLTVVAALLYFLNPFDLVPDAILGIGLMDDLAVLTWVYKNAKQELNNFIHWEKQQHIEIENLKPSVK
ncbi:MAG: YkvA family protein [Cyclobacteriaceae bacterium]